MNKSLCKRVLKVKDIVNSIFRRVIGLRELLCRRIEDRTLLKVIILMVFLSLSFNVFSVIKILNMGKNKKKNYVIRNKYNNENGEMYENFDKFLEEQDKVYDKLYDYDF